MFDVDRSSFLCLFKPRVVGTEVQNEVPSVVVPCLSLWRSAVVFAFHSPPVENARVVGLSTDISLTSKFDCIVAFSVMVNSLYSAVHGDPKGKGEGSGGKGYGKDHC